MSETEKTQLFLTHITLSLHWDLSENTEDISAHAALGALTSGYDDLPVCAIRLHGLDNVFFGVTPVDPVSIQIIQSQSSGPAEVLFLHQDLSVLTVHPR